MGELRRVDELAREYWAELDKEPERNEEGKPWNNN